MRKAGENLVIVDGRPFAEYQKMSIPGGICCPNGELALRIRDIAPDPGTAIVVNCAGRTRSIIGAQTLIDFGVANPVYALENGTQGWFLAGLALEAGASRRYARDDRDSRHRRAAGARPHACRRPRRRVRRARRGSGAGSPMHRARPTCSTCGRRKSSPKQRAWVCACAGGQLIQATDQWVGVRGARLVLLDSEEVRAPVAAAWLRQLGHEACVLAGGAAAAAKFAWPQRSRALTLPEPKAMTPRAAADALRDGAAQMVDLRPSMAYRRGHVPQAVWSIRPRLATACCRSDEGRDPGCR